MGNQKKSNVPIMRIYEPIKKTYNQFWMLERRLH